MKHKKIPHQYQKAFFGLLRRLVLPKDYSGAIPCTTLDLSKLIQQHYIVAYESYKNGIIKELQRFTRLLVVDTRSNETIYETSTGFAQETCFNMLQDGTSLLSPLERICLVQQALRVDADCYSPWGFTPRLAAEDGEKKFGIGLNCFGFVSVIGSYLNSCGISVRLGIAPDHPFVIAHLDEGVRFVDRDSVNMPRAPLVQYGVYHIYRRTHEEQWSPKMLIAHDFDEALLYEILENLEVLRQLSLGNSSVSLPRSHAEGVVIAETHKDVLQALNWKELQCELCPAIASSFLQHHKEWNMEVTRVSSMRRIQYAQEVFEKASREAQEQTSYKDQEFEKGQKNLRDLFCDHYEEIMLYLIHGMTFTQFVPLDIQNYFAALKAYIEKEDGAHKTEAMNWICTTIERKLIDMNMEKRYKRKKSH